MAPRRHPDQARVDLEAGGQRHHEHGRENEREARQLERRLVERRGRRDRGVGAALDPPRQHLDPREVDRRQGDPAGLAARQAEPAQPRRRQHEMRLAAGQRLDAQALRGVEILDPDHEPAAVPGLALDDHRAGGPDLRDRALHRKRLRRRGKAQNKTHRHHSSPETRRFNIASILTGSLVGHAARRERSLPPNCTALYHHCVSMAELISQW